MSGRGTGNGADCSFEWSLDSKRRSLLESKAKGGQGSVNVRKAEAAERAESTYKYLNRSSIAGYIVIVEEHIVMLSRMRLVSL